MMLLLASFPGHGLGTRLMLYSMSYNVYVHCMSVAHKLLIDSSLVPRPTCCFQFHERMQRTWYISSREWTLIINIMNLPVLDIGPSAIISG